MAETNKRKMPRKRRAEVLDAAARVFNEKGYDATSIQDIADEIGILKGSLYYYISSKEDALFEVLQEVHEAALAAVVEAVEFDGNALQRIRAFVETLARFNADNSIRMGVLLHDFRSLSEPRRGAIVRERDQYDQILRKLINKGKREGVICKDIDPKLTALAIMGMINSIYQWYQPSGSRRSANIGSAYADFVVAALACTPETHVAGHLSDRAALVAASEVPA